MRFECSSHAPVLDGELFAFVTEHAVRMATRLRYPVSLLTLLPHVDGDVDDGVGQDLVTQLARALSPVIRDTDLISGRPVPLALHLLLFDAPLEALPPIIQRIAAEVDAFGFRANGERTAVTLSIGGACVPATAGTAEELVSRAEALAAEASKDDWSGFRYRLRPS